MWASPNALHGILSRKRPKIPSVDRAKEICRAIGLDFHVGPQRNVVPKEVAYLLGLAPDAKVAEIVAAIHAARDPRVVALVEAAAALQQAQDWIYDAAGWKQMIPVESRRKVTEILEFMGLDKALAIQQEQGKKLVKH